MLGARRGASARRAVDPGRQRGLAAPAPRGVVREVAFYLLAGAHTSATALTRVLHNVFTWLERAPGGRRAGADRPDVPPALHARDDPPATVVADRRCAGRWQTSRSSSGRDIPKGAKVVIDLMHRQPRRHGVRRRRRHVSTRTACSPDGSLPYGLSFGMGMHACIGENLAAGSDLRRRRSRSTSTCSASCPMAVQAMFDHGVRPDPDDPPEMDTTTARPYFGRYPVLLGP